MLKNKNIIALLLVVALLVTMFGCKTASAPATDAAPVDQVATDDESEEQANEPSELEPTDKLNVWLSYAEGSTVANIMYEAKDIYETLYPNVKVEISCMGGELYTALDPMLQDPSDPDLPDVFDAGDNNFLPYNQADALYCLDDALKTPSFDDANVAWGDTLMASLVEAEKYEGKSWIVPWSFYSCGFFYDQNQFQALGLEIPTTWEELIEVKKTLNDNGIDLIALDGTLDGYNIWFFTVMAERYVQDAQNKMQKLVAGEGSWKDEEGFLKAAELMQQMCNEGFFQKGYEGSAYPACQAVFAQGKAATHFCGGWLPSEMSAITPETMSLNVFPMPALPGETCPGTTEVWGNGMAITKAAHNKLNAINWLKLCTSKQIADKFVEGKIASPVLTANANPATSGYNEFVKNAPVVYGCDAGLTHIGTWTTNVLGPLSTQLLTGKINATEFIEQLDVMTADYVKAQQ